MELLQIPEPSTFEYLKDIVIPLLSALAGAILGGWLATRAAFNATKLAHVNARNLENERNSWMIRGLLLGLETEIKSLRGVYENEFVEDLRALPDGTPFEMHFPITQGYFTVFESSAHLLGQIPDDKLRKCIIEIYLGAKGIIDTHLYNNQLLAERDIVDTQFSQDGIGSDDKRKEINQALIDYAPNIKQNYENAIILIEKFEERLPIVLTMLKPSDDAIHEKLLY